MLEIIKGPKAETYTSSQVKELLQIHENKYKAIKYVQHHYCQIEQKN